MSLLTFQLLLVPLFFIIASANPIRHLAGQERNLNVNYAHFGADGPLGWTGLNKADWAMCSTGSNQSPINLELETTSTSNNNTWPVFNKIATAERPCEFNGHTFEVDMKGAGVTTTLEDKKYTLDQFHFHTPSEHFLEGEYFPLEMHMVHSPLTAGSSNLVLGILFDITRDTTDPFVASALKNIDQINSSRPTTKTGPLIFMAVERIFTESDLYEYVGSLTTPPCTEGVSWVIAKQTSEISLGDWQKLKKLLKYNARYIQNTPSGKNLIKVASSSLPSPGK